MRFKLSFSEPLRNTLWFAEPIRNTLWFAEPIRCTLWFVEPTLCTIWLSEPILLHRSKQSSFFGDLQTRSRRADAKSCKDIHLLAEMLLESWRRIRD